MDSKFFGCVFRKRTRCLSFGIGYQRVLGKKKLRPYLSSDISFVSEDYFKHSGIGNVEFKEFTSNGFCLNGGVGLRYEFSQKLCLAYEANLGLYMRQVNGQEYTITRYPEKSNSRTTWSDDILRNWVVNPISNL